MSPTTRIKPVISGSRWPARISIGDDGPEYAATADKNSRLAAMTHSAAIPSGSSPGSSSDGSGAMKMTAPTPVNSHAAARAQPLLALNAAIWHNWQIGAPVKRSLIPCDHP